MTRLLRLHRREAGLREKLISSIQRGDRCFIACNSKKTVHVLEKIIRQRCGAKVPMRTVTSDNSRDPSEIEFVKNIRTEILKVQVFICSPSLGTGIDLTFPDPDGKEIAGLREIDAVFGFFHAKVNTHTDMDQQLSRVRNPGSVHVWISPVRFQFTSNFDVIREDLARARYVPQAVRGYSSDGLTDYDPHHPLLMIYTHVIAGQRASKNRLVELFCELRTSQGWTIEHVDDVIEKNRDRPDAERALWREHTQALFNAPILDDLEYFDLCVRRECGDPLTVSERLAFERNELQRCLGVDLTYEMIKLNHDGLLISRVERLSKLLRLMATTAHVATTVLAEQQKTLARLPKLDPVLLLHVIAICAGLANSERLVAGVRVTAASLSSFAVLCADNQTLIEEQLGTPMRGDLRANPVRQLNSFLKLAGLKLEPIKRRKKCRKSVREYGFDDQKFQLMISLARAFKSPDSLKDELAEQRRVA